MSRARFPSREELTDATQGRVSDLTLLLELGHPASGALGKEVNGKDVSAKHTNFEHNISNRISQLGEENKNRPVALLGSLSPWTAVTPAAQGTSSVSCHVVLRSQSQAQRRKPFQLSELW